MSTMQLAIVILTYNEELNLPACLASVCGLTDHLLVVDSGSSDRTRYVAAEHGARVLTHEFVNHGQQWRWALDQLDPEVDWVLGLDADQQLSPELRDELAELFSTNHAWLQEYAGFYLNRRQIFRGKWIHHGGYYPKYLLKLFRLRNVQLDERELMDHHFYVRGKTGALRHDLVEDNRKEASIAFWLSKHIRYAELYAREELARRSSGNNWLIRPSLFGSPDQRVLWCKALSYRMPLYTRPFVYFIYRYFVRGGIFDGRQGFVFHFLQAFWYRLLIDIQIDELTHTQAR